MIEIIPIRHETLLKQKLLEFLDGSITLLDDRFIYKIQFYAEEEKGEDGNLGWEEVYQDLEYTVKKSSIQGILKEHMTDVDIWRVSFCCWGLGFDIHVFDKSEKVTVDLYNKIIKWWFND